MEPGRRLDPPVAPGSHPPPRSILLPPTTLQLCNKHAQCLLTGCRAAGQAGPVNGARMDQHRGERPGAGPWAGRSFAVFVQGLWFLRGLVFQAGNFEVEEGGTGPFSLWLSPLSARSLSPLYSTGAPTQLLGLLLPGLNQFNLFRGREGVRGKRYLLATLKTFPKPF